MLHFGICLQNVMKKYVPLSQSETLLFRLDSVKMI